MTSNRISHDDPPHYNVKETVTTGIFVMELKPHDLVRVKVRSKNGTLTILSDITCYRMVLGMVSGLTPQKIVMAFFLS